VDSQQLVSQQLVSQQLVWQQLVWQQQGSQQLRIMRQQRLNRPASAWLSKARLAKQATATIKAVRKTFLRLISNLQKIDPGQFRFGETTSLAALTLSTIIGAQNVEHPRSLTGPLPAARTQGLSRILAAQILPVCRALRN
jgi:hypothetical protein